MKVVKLPDLRVVYKVVQDTWHELKSCLLLKERYQKRADGASKSRCGSAGYGSGVTWSCTCSWLETRLARVQSALHAYTSRRPASSQKKTIHLKQDWLVSCY